MIRFEQLVIGYQTQLLSIDFETLEAGKAYALIGANGSGKSTFLKTIAGQLSTISGKISINEVDIAQLKAGEKAKLVAFVSSRFPELANISVQEYIGLGRTPYLNALGRLSDKDRSIVHSSIVELNIQHLSNKMISELSDGEKQLCAIARAICQETNIILLDEPSNFLDYKNRQLILDKINQLAKNRCIIFSSHDLEMVSARFDNFLLVKSQDQQLIKLAASMNAQELAKLAFD
ncbi:MAG: ABC transporter ATP-binding protein [Bacteroidota bacterium]